MPASTDGCRHLHLDADRHLRVDARAAPRGIYHQMLGPRSDPASGTIRSSKPSTMARSYRNSHTCGSGVQVRPAVPALGFTPRDQENASVSISGPSPSGSTIHIAGRAARHGAAGGDAHDPELSMHLDVVVGAPNDIHDAGVQFQRNHLAGAELHTCRSGYHFQAARFAPLSYACLGEADPHRDDLVLGVRRSAGRRPPRAP